MSLSSPFANLYVDLVTRIKAEVASIKWIDFDLGQLEAYDNERPPVEWPCLLIDFTETGFNQMQGYQEGDVQVQLRLAFDEYEETHGDTPALIQESALEYLEIEHAIHLALQAWKANNSIINALIRQSAASEKREGDNFRVRRLVYTCTFDDASVTG